MSAGSRPWYAFLLTATIATACGLSLVPDQLVNFEATLGRSSPASRSLTQVWQSLETTSMTTLANHLAYPGVAFLSLALNQEVAAAAKQLAITIESPSDMPPQISEPVPPSAHQQDLAQTTHMLLRLKSWVDRYGAML